jgi:Fe-Mn family superoxide dismutase
MKDPDDFTRRNALIAVAAGTAGVLAGCAATASGEPPPNPSASTKPIGSASPAAPTATGAHAVVALPFDATKLTGLSEKLLVSHHDNNYAGAVKNLNKTEAELALVNKDTAGFVVSGLRSSELTFRNSVTLHEAYFANLGGSGKPSPGAQSALAATFGSMARWEELFRATGAGLAGGSGWVVLAYDLLRDTPHTYGAQNHREVDAGSVPLLVMDMYEHAYALDYGAAAAKYIDAFFANVQWDEVDKRLERAKKAAAAMRA